MNYEERLEQRLRDELAAQAVPMSQQDQVVITQSEPDAVGTYVVADQMRQDAYAQMLIQQQAQQSLHRPQAHHLDDIPHDVRAALGSGVYNPNARTVEPTRTTLDSKGNVVIY